MVEKPTRTASCDGKVKMTANHAKRASRSIRERGDPVRPYACHYCGHWHVGGFTKAVRKRPDPSGVHA